jgi:hypothetical protein
VSEAHNRKKQAFSFTAAMSDSSDDELDLMRTHGRDAEDDKDLSLGGDSEDDFCDSNDGKDGDHSADIDDDDDEDEDEETPTPRKARMRWTLS